MGLRRQFRWRHSRIAVACGALFVLSGLLTVSAQFVLVSVALILSIDTGGERFGFFLPLIDVAHGQTAHFHTVGIYETFSGPNSVPHRPSTWRCIEMTGTAQNVIVPLEVPAKV